MAGYEGFAALGDVLTGGADRRAVNKEAQYEKQRYDAFGALEEAKRKRAVANIEGLKLEARTAAGPAYQALVASQGGTPELGALGAAFAGGGNMNFNEFMGGAAKGSDLEIDRQIQARLEAGDAQGARTLAAVKTDKVLPALGTNGQTVFDPVTGTATLTPLGTAKLGNEGAIAEARVAKYGAPPATRGGPRTLTQAEADAKMDYIMAEGTRLGKERGAAWTEAWMKDQASKAGILAQFDTGETDAPSLSPLGNVVPAGSTTPKVVETGQAGKKTNIPAVRVTSPNAAPIGSVPPGVSTYNEQQTINDARKAIAMGKLTKEQAQQKMRDAGMVKAAAQL